MDRDEKTFNDGRIQIGFSGDVISLSFFGDLHPRDSLELSSFFDQIILTAIEQKAEIFADFRNMGLIYSRCIYSIMQFIRRLSESRVKGEFIYDSSKLRHQVSFQGAEFIARNSQIILVRGA